MGRARPNGSSICASSSSNSSNSSSKQPALAVSSERLQVLGVALTDIKNFVLVNESLATAGQPQESELADVAASGFDLVVNLGLSDPRYCLPDEAGSLAKLGLEYRHIPVEFKAPTVEDFRRFEATLLESAGRRVFAHCAANYRVSCFVALYGEVHLGWSREQADAHATRLWRLDEVWTAFMAAVRAQSE